MPRALLILSCLITIAAAICAATGVFDATPGPAVTLQSVHGQEVTLFGKGLYATESRFMAPIQQGSDATILFVVLPLFVGVTFAYARGEYRAGFLHVGIMAILIYYGASMAFGTSYNHLFPLYILLFSSSLFAFTVGLITLGQWRPDPDVLAAMPRRGMPRRGLIAFLCVGGCGVLVWLTEVIPAALTQTVPSTLGMSTTSVTFVLDIGVIAPACFWAAWMVWRGRAFGYVLGMMMLVAYGLMGVMVIGQTLFQRANGVIITPAQLAIFVGSFVVLCLLAIVILWRCLRALPRTPQP